MFIRIQKAPPVLPDGSHLSVGCRHCGLALEGWGGQAGVARRGRGGSWSLRSRRSKSLLGTCRLWLDSQLCVVWHGLRADQPFATVPADPLPCPASGEVRRQGRGISSGLCYVTRLCRLALVTTARRGDCFCAQSPPEHPKFPRAHCSPSPCCGDGTCGCCLCRVTCTQVPRCCGPSILPCWEGVGKAVISSARSLTHPGFSAQAVPLSGAHILFQLNQRRQASST